MELQKFVTDVIESAGGIVIPLEYALCHAILPESCKDLFNGRSELTLAFDPEVHQENQDSEFITFGSFILDRIMEYCRKTPACTIRFVVAERIMPANPQDKIGRIVNTSGRCSVSILSEKPVIVIWPVFVFRVTYISDEKMAEVRDVWVDPLDYTVSSDMLGQKAGIFYEKEAVYDYPVLAAPDMTKAFEVAYRQCMTEVNAIKDNYARSDELNMERERIKGYYGELEAENKRKMHRKGITEEKCREITARSQALEIEKEKQLREIEEKYRVRTEIELDNGVLYMIPQVEYRIRISSREGDRDALAYYNPVLKGFKVLKNHVTS